MGHVKMAKGDANYLNVNIFLKAFYDCWTIAFFIFFISDKGKDKVQRKSSSGDRKKHYKKTKSGERKKEKQSKNNGNALPVKSAEKTDAKVIDHKYHMYKRKNRKNKSQKVSQSGQLQRESSESDSESLKRSRDGSTSKRIVDRDNSTKSFQTKKRRKLSSHASYWAIWKM